MRVCQTTTPKLYELKHRTFNTPKPYKTRALPQKPLLTTKPCSSLCKPFKTYTPNHKHFETLENLDLLAGAQSAKPCRLTPVAGVVLVHALGFQGRGSLCGTTIFRDGQTRAAVASHGKTIEPAAISCHFRGTRNTTSGLTMARKPNTLNPRPQSRQP